MNPAAYASLAHALAAERLDAYRQDGADDTTTLARYAWNVALCEALYSPLQLAEVALRNALHRALADRYATEDWFVAVTPRLLRWQQASLTEARRSLQNAGKTCTPGRMVAELSFGFWTAFFNRAHARTGLSHHLAATVFPHAPTSHRDASALDARWQRVRQLRNRVFHHERIVHYRDLATQHREIVSLIGWISPALRDFATSLDRFADIHAEGIAPWRARLNARHDSGQP